MKDRTLVDLYDSIEIAIFDMDSWTI